MRPPVWLRRPWRPWSQRIPAIGDPDKRAFVTELAAAMDARRERIGEHAASAEPAWAITALGPVPGDPLERLEWQERTAAIGAYRELYGIDSETDPVGPEPVNSPEARSAWMAACSAQLHVDPAGLDTLPDSVLLARRAQYQADTAWAPPYAGRELRQVHAAAIDMAARDIRHRAEAAAAHTSGDQLLAARHNQLAASAEAAATFYRERALLDEQLHAAREQWNLATAAARLEAIQADAELRRRYPGMRLEPLMSAEPAPLPDALPLISAAEQRAHAARVRVTSATVRSQADRRNRDLAGSMLDRRELSDRRWPDLSSGRRSSILRPPTELMPPPPRRSARTPQTQYEPQA